MSKRQYPLIYAKVPACLMHIAAVIIALIGISLMYLNNNFGKGLESLSIESYEDTPGFYEQLRRDVNDIFKYVRYRNVFETDGKIDYTKPMLEMTYGPGDERSYSLNYIVEYTKARGFYLDDQFQVSGTSNANFEPDLEEGYVEWKAYDEIFSGSAETESQNFSSLEELSQEILSLLGEYYSICNRLLNTSSNLYFKIVYSNPGNKDLVYTNAPDLVPEKLRTYGPYIYVSGESAVVNSNLDSSSLNITSLLSAYNPYEDSNSYYMVLAVDTKFPATDSYSIAAAKYQESRKLYLAGCILMAFGLVFSLATIICLMIFSGHKYSKDETITLHGFDNGPTESAFALFFVIAAAGLFLCRQIGVRITHVLLARDSWDYIEQLMYLSVLYLAGLIVGFSLLRRYKARILWSSSLLKRAMEALQIFHLKQTFSAQIIALFVTYSAVNLLIIGGSFYLFSNWLFGSQALQVAIGVAAVLWLALNLWALYMILQKCGPAGPPGIGTHADRRGRDKLPGKSRRFPRKRAGARRENQPLKHRSGRGAAGKSKERTAEGRPHHQCVPRYQDAAHLHNQLRGSDQAGAHTGRENHRLSGGAGAEIPAAQDTDRGSGGSLQGQLRKLKAGDQRHRSGGAGTADQRRI